MYDLHKIKKQLSKALDHKRYEHTLGVAYTSASLAMRYGEDIHKAEVAGLLHDCAKCMDNDKKVAICEKHKIQISEAEHRNHFLLHAKVGAYLAAKKYHIKDKDILNAITYHTTGRPAMSLLEKIVYVADYIEPRRDHAPNLSEIRTLAFTDIDQVLVKILGDILLHLKEINKEIDPMTQFTYDYYHQLISEKL